MINNLKKNNIINIEDFINLVHEQIPEFTRNEQQDCSEFLQIILEKLSFYEECMLIPSISSIFSFEIERITGCSGCSLYNKTYSIENMLYVEYNKDLIVSIEQYFKETQSEHSCGGIEVNTIRMVTNPIKFIISLKRYEYENNRFTKINDPIEINDIKLGNIIKEGYNSENTIIKNRNKSYKLKDATEYTIEGAIIHSGQNLNCGHYTWFIKGENSYLVNDESVIPGKIRN